MSTRLLGQIVRMLAAHNHLPQTGGPLASPHAFACTHAASWGLSPAEEGGIVLESLLQLCASAAAVVQWGSMAASPLWAQVCCACTAVPPAVH